jgi:hypothetical protein
MSTRRLLGAATVAILASIVVLGFGGSYTLDCGPLDRTSCEQRAGEVVAIVSREFEGSRISSIVIIDDSGHATVVLRGGMRIDVIGQMASEQMV